MPLFGPSLGYVAKSQKKAGTINISILDNVKPHEPKPGDIQFTKYFLKQNHGFIVMSENVKNDLLEFVPDADYRLVQHPLYDHFGSKIDKSAARRQLGIPGDKNVLLFFGFIRDYKGLDILLETMETLPDNYLLLVAGEVYGNFDEYAKIISKLKLENKVKLFIRYIPDSEVPLFFSASDVCMLPYKSATQSGIVGINYHFDLPSIATGVGGLREMITPYGTGLVADEPKQHLLSAAIADYFNMEMKESLGQNIQRYKNIANWETLAREILNLYKDIKK